MRVEFDGRLAGGGAGEISCQLNTAPHGWALIQVNRIAWSRGRTDLRWIKAAPAAAVMAGRDNDLSGVPTSCHEGGLAENAVWPVPVVTGIADQFTTTRQEEKP